MKYTLANKGGRIIEGCRLRNSETGVLADFWTRHKIKGYYSDQTARAEIAERGMEIRAVDVD